MAAYMKTTQPFAGVQKPARQSIIREIRDRFAPQTRAEYEARVLALWRGRYREEQYLAIAYARLYPAFVSAASLPLYERMIREGAWWDFVDEIAVHLVGVVLRRDRAHSGRLLDRWIEDQDMWIRRTALIAHLTHKAETDATRLFAHILLRAGDREFFIRKAIGWILREYGKTAPAAVRTFIRAHHARLSPLSLKEGARRLNPPLRFPKPNTARRSQGANPSASRRNVL